MEFKLGPYDLYNCNACRAECTGKRWHCSEHQTDICLDCAVPPLQALVEVLAAPGDAGSHAQACRVLGKAVREEAEKREALRLGAAAAVVRAMQEGHHDDVLQCLGCAALRALCAGTSGDSELARSVALEGGVRIALQAMHGHPMSVNVQEAGCRVLRQLALVEQNRCEILEAAGVEAIAVAVRNHETSPRVQEGACLALGNLAVHPDSAARISRELLAAVVRGMERHEATAAVQEAATFALYNLICTSQCLDLVGELGGVTAVKKAMQQHPAIADMEEAQAITEES